MKSIYFILILILVCSLFFLIGYKTQKIVNDRFKDNVIPIVGILKSELNEINIVLTQDDLPINWKNDLLERRQELIDELNLFYGKVVY